MKHREKIQKLIKSKLQEISNLEGEILKAKSFVLGLEESLKYLPKDDDDVTSDDDREPREGSVVAQVRDHLRRVGHAQHISEILVGIGRTNDNRSRASVAGSISSYARMGLIFEKTGGNKFGLKEFAKKSSLPEGFGKHAPVEGVGRAS